MMEYSPTNEQKLIDIMFNAVMLVHSHKAFKNMSREEVADWLSKELHNCGFVTEPQGQSWAVLQEIR